MPGNSVSFQEIRLKFGVFREFGFKMKSDLNSLLDFLTIIIFKIVQGFIKLKKKIANLEKSS